MARTPRIGILTGGGDVPGLNSVIKGVTYRSAQLGYEVIGIRRGWEGLTHMQRGAALDPEYLRVLDRINTRTIDRTGGTVLHTSRTNPTKMKTKTLPPALKGAAAEQYRVGEDLFDITPYVLENIASLNLDYIVAIGGDDTLSFARVLHDAGVPIIAVPKTMDNDVQGTEYCIGFSSAITRAKEVINRQRTTFGSHERIAVFRIFGRDAGFSALYTSYVTSARCLIPEYQFDIDHLAELLVGDKRGNPSKYALVVAAEGAIWKGGEIKETGEADAFGHRHKANVAEVLADEIKARTGEDAVASELTYDLRSGEADSLDQIVATTFGNIAMDLIAEGKKGLMVAIRDGKYAFTELPKKGLGPRTVDVAKAYDTDRYRPIYGHQLGAPMLLTTAAADVAR